MKAIGYILGIIFLVAYSAFVGLSLYNWLILPVFSLPELSYPEWFGISTMINYFKLSVASDNRYKDLDFVEAFGVIVLTLTFTLAFGYAVSLFY